MAWAGESWELGFPMSRSGRPNNRRVCCSLAVGIVLSACGGTRDSVRLEPERPTTLHLGQVAVVQVPSERHYSIGPGGRSLILTKQAEQNTTTFYFYRAVGVGNETLIATPRDPGPGGCVSCVTVHYFIKVFE